MQNALWGLLHFAFREDTLTRPSATLSRKRERAL
jgi:hypothetical protein